MMNSHYDSDRLAQVHRRDLLREAEHERLLTQLPQPDPGITRLRVLFKLAWRALRIRLQKGFRQRSAS